MLSLIIVAIIMLLVLTIGLVNCAFNETCNADSSERLSQALSKKAADKSNKPGTNKSGMKNDSKLLSSSKTLRLEKSVQSKFSLLSAKEMKTASNSKHLSKSTIKVLASSSSKLGSSARELTTKSQATPIKSTAILDNPGKSVRISVNHPADEKTKTDQTPDNNSDQEPFLKTTLNKWSTFQNQFTEGVSNWYVRMVGRGKESEYKTTIDVEKQQTTEAKSKSNSKSNRGPGRSPATKHKTSRIIKLKRPSELFPFGSECSINYIKTQKFTTGGSTIPDYKVVSSMESNSNIN